MVDSLNATPGGLPLSDDAYATAQAKAAIRLAGMALRVTGGDRERARAELRIVLKAIGLLP